MRHNLHTGIREKDAGGRPRGGGGLPENLRKATRSTWGNRHPCQEIDGTMSGHENMTVVMMYRM